MGTVAQIVEAAKKLTPEERYEIRMKLAELDPDGWLDDDDPLSDRDKARIEARIEAHDKDPGSAIPWEEFDARLKRRLGE